MDQTLIAEILTGDSDEVEDLKANLPVLEGFIQLARELETLPETSKRFYEESRSLYQATCTDRPMADLETLLAKFFGPPVKPAGKPLPRKLRKNASVKYLGGVEQDQSLFLIQLKTGEFYGALWPWRRNKAKIEIHMGYCSDWMVDDHYHQLERLVKRSLSHSAFQQIDTSAGGQIHGIGLPSFLQMAEMEQSSFTLRITSAGRTGKLYVAEGDLIDAETAGLNGRNAAYHIIAWDDVRIEIAPADPSKEHEIKQPLMHVLMESLKIKDEITSSFEEAPAPPPPKPRPKAGEIKLSKRLVRLERAPAPNAPRSAFSFSVLFAVIVGILVVGGSGLVLGLYILNNRAASDQLVLLRHQVENADSLEQKLDLLQTYLQSHPRSPHEADVKTDIEKVHRSMEDRDFEQTTLKISNLPVDDQYEKTAITLYGDFLEKYPESRYQERINTAIADIKNLVDQYYYEELKRAARLDLSGRLQVYKQYLDRFPQGRYHKDVGVLIKEMGHQYLQYLKTEDAQCEQKRRWEPCLQHYESFIKDFEGTPLAKEARDRIATIEDRRDLIQLKKAREAAGNDYEKAYRNYRDYLNAHPKSTQKSTIVKEMAVLEQGLKNQRQWESIRSYAMNPQHGLYERIQKLDRYLRDNLSSPFAGEAQELMSQLEAQRRTALIQNKREAQKREELARIQREKDKTAQQQIKIQQMRVDVEQKLRASKRYRVNGGNTFTDMATGLTWMLLDSYQELGGCINFASAKEYVQSLDTGGHRDWRLPSAGELAALYKQAPFFPDSGAEWYWTSEAYARGYHTVVDVVTAKPETVFQREYRTIDQCGSVRAIRP